MKLVAASEDNRRILACTRIHSMEAATLTSPWAVMEFTNSIPIQIGKILICLGCDDSPESDRYLFALKRATSHNDRVVILRVSPWGRFTHALNVGVNYGSENGFELIQFMVG